MTELLLWQATGSNSSYTSFAPGIDPRVYGPPLVPTGIPYWFVTPEFILAKEAIYGGDRIGWVLIDDPDLGPPAGYGA